MNFLRNFENMLKNLLYYGKFSLNKNSQAYFNDAYSKRKTEYVPEHYFEIVEFLPSNGQFTICDFGCGTGEGLLFMRKRFPDAKFTAVDYSKVAIQKSKEKVADATYICLDITKQSLPEIYDYIVTVETLEHFRNPFKIIEKLLKHTKKLLISVPYTENPNSVGRVRGYAKHLYNFNETSLNRYPNASVLKITDYFNTTKQKCIFYMIDNSHI